MKCSGLKVTQVLALWFPFPLLKNCSQADKSPPFTLLSLTFPTELGGWYSHRFRSSLVHSDVCHTTPCLFVMWCLPVAKFSGSALN